MPTYEQDHLSQRNPGPTSAIDLPDTDVQDAASLFGIEDQDEGSRLQEVRGEHVPEIDHGLSASIKETTLAILRRALPSIAG